MLVPPDTSRLALKLRDAIVGSCAACRGTGTVLSASDDEPWDAKSVACDCAKLVRHRLGLREARMPREFIRVLDRIPERNVDRFERVKAYVAALDAHYSEGDGFLFYGLNGAGKTMFSCYILSAAVQAGYTAAYLTAKELAGAAGQARGDDQFRAWFQAFLARDFLVLDELGKEYRNGSEYALSELDDLLRNRRGARLPTIVCTNMSLHEFRDGYGHSFYSLTKDVMEHLAFEASTDFRDVIKRRKSGKV